MYRPIPIKLELLNSFELSVRDRVVTLRHGSQQLIAFVALNTGCVSRDYMFAVLWPESSRRQANGNLRTTLWRLPTEVRDIVAADAVSVRLSPEVDCDVDHFVTHARHMIAGAELPARINFGTAFHHDLLPTWYEDWVLLEREQLRQLRMRALESLAAALNAAGRHCEAIDAALMAVAAEPLRETGYRCLVEAHRAEGNQNEAVRQFKYYSAMLAAELNSTPSPVLRQLAYGNAKT
jgi:DNA-binding SARP family transcriptional activator